MPSPMPTSTSGFVTNNLIVVEGKYKGMEGWYLYKCPVKHKVYLHGVRAFVYLFDYQFEWMKKSEREYTHTSPGLKAMVSRLAFEIHQYDLPIGEVCTMLEDKVTEIKDGLSH